MHRLTILGDSNVYRNTTSAHFTKRVNLPTTLIEATRLTSLEIGLKSAAKDDSSAVLISALGNILCDSGEGVDPDLRSECLKATIADYVKLITSNLSSKSNTFLQHPTFRSEPAWFGPLLPLVKSTLSIECARYPSITLLPDFCSTGIDLSKDGVHFLPEKGMEFIAHLASCILDVLSSPQPSTSRSSPSTLFVPNPASTVEDVMILLQTSVLPKLDELTGLKNQVTRLEQSVFSRMNHNDIVTARLAEEQDLAQNKETSDRVVVVGYKSENYPKNQADRKNFLAGKFRRLIEPILGEIVIDIYPKDENLPPTGIVPPFEIKFHKSKLCGLFKQSAFRKIKEEELVDEFGNVSFFPKVTMGTRVRVEVLRALARKVTSNEESAYCPIFNIRPVLHVGPVTNGKVTRTKTLTYVDSVLRYRHLINVSDLSFAYKQVGAGFTNSLRQTFIVLNEEDRQQPGSVQSYTPGASSQNRGQKRKHEGGRGRGSRGSFAKRGK